MSATTNSQASRPKVAVKNKPANNQNGESSQLQKAMSMASYFLSGAMAINASQFLGAPLQLINKDWYNAWIAWTKESFGLLMMTLTQWWAPTVVKVSGDKSMRGQLTKNEDGTLRCMFPQRLVLMANHQIYTDWLYLWWIAYTNKMHGRVYIILKESLKTIPVLGWGMQLSQFLFMKRNWEKDKPNLQKHLAKLRRPTEPMWLMLFPEGTVACRNTRETSKAWALKNGIKDMQHQLLPRSTGLQFCLQQLKGSLDYLYDCTIAYEGVGRGEYAFDHFALPASYLQGKPPKSVHIYWRRFPISSIPLNDHEVFTKWLAARWREKDYLLEMWHQHGHFPADTGAEKLPNGIIRRGCGYISTQIRPTQWYEFLQIFAPMGVIALVLSVFYGALPDWFLNAATKQALQANSVPVPQVQVNGAEKPISWLSFLDPEKQGGVVQQVIQKLLPGADLMALANTEPPEEIDAKVAMVKSNFFKKLEEEQASRKARKPILKPSVGFAQAVKDEETKRRGSTTTGTISKAPSVSFAEAMKDETAKRGGSTATGSVSRRPSLTSQNLSLKSTTNFSQALKDEQAKRQGTIKTVSTSKISTASSPKVERKPSVSFSQAVKDEEAKRRGSTISVTTSKVSERNLPKANFSQGLKDEMAKRNGTVITDKSQALSVQSGTSGTFFNKMKAEEAKRNKVTGSKPLSNAVPKQHASSAPVTRPKSNPPAAAGQTSTATTPKVVSGTISAKKAPAKTSTTATPSMKKPAPVAAKPVPLTTSKMVNTPVTKPAAKTVEQSKTEAAKGSPDSTPAPVRRKPPKLAKKS